MKYKWCGLAAAAAVMLGAQASSSPSSAADIDFEGLIEGQIVDEVSSGNGITGDVKGEVGVFGFDGVHAGQNRAMVYDSSCLPGGTPADCTGGDDDLGTPNMDFGGPGLDEDGDPTIGGNAGSEFENAVGLGNILIISEDLDGSDPDDADNRGMFYNFDFTKIKGGGTVTVNSVTVMDVEQEEGETGANIVMTGPKIPTSLVSIPNIGDNGVVTIDLLGLEGVRNLRIESNGSGAVASVIFNEGVDRLCWVTTGGFFNAGVTSGDKQCTFGGNVGPPPSGAFEVNFHDGPYNGLRFHTNDITAVECIDMGSTGPQQPGGKKGLEVDTLVFECTGRLNNVDGFTCAGFLKDAGEPQGKNNNDHDAIELQVFDSGGNLAAECVGELDGGNVQIHPPVGNK